MNILDWWKELKGDTKALSTARENRQEQRQALTDAVVALHNDQTQLKSLMAAMLEKRGGRDA